MTCSLCPKVALYIAGKRYYCRDHHSEAVARTAEMGSAIQSKKGVDDYRKDVINLNRIHAQHR